MKEGPILFSSEMLRAILAGRKTQTRRVITRNAPKVVDGAVTWYPGGEKLGFKYIGVEGHSIEVASGWAASWCPYGALGDLLWVRETWANPGGAIYYRADGEFDQDLKDMGYTTKWKPAIFMPRELSRITLEIVKVRVERVQDISEEDALAEGITLDPREGRFSCVTIDKHGHVDNLGHYLMPRPRQKYEGLWNSINAKRGFGWDLNPWVWVLEFKRCNKCEDHK